MGVQVIVWDPCKGIMTCCVTTFVCAAVFVGTAQQCQEGRQLTVTLWTVMYIICNSTGHCQCSASQQRC